VIFLLLFIVAAMSSLLLTWVLRRYALKSAILDMPKERSSHSMPTPRGGGAAIALVFLTGLIVLKLAGSLPAPLFLAFFVSGAWVSLIGWADDLCDIPARLRLFVHIMGAVWALAWLGGFPQITIFGLETDLGIAGQVLASIYLVWLLNLYNFMDGINGIAGIEAITVCLGGAVLFALLPDQELGMLILPILLAAASSGFLFWNFPGARIFMGDAGSGFLGLMMGALSIQAAWIAPELFWGWVILMGAFIVDATVTLLRRALQGEKLYQAHRSHAYQHAALSYGHTMVSLTYGAVNLLWLLPVAALVVTGLLDGVLGVVVAYTPLVVLAFWFKAGTFSTS